MYHPLSIRSSKLHLPNPFLYNEDEEEYLLAKPSNQALNPDHDQPPPVDLIPDPALIPVVPDPAPDIVRRSERVPKPTKDFQTACLDKAIQNSRDSAQRIAEAQSC